MEHLEIIQTEKTPYPIKIVWDNCTDAIEILSNSNVPGIKIEQENEGDPYLIHIPNRKTAYEAVFALNEEINAGITHYKDRDYFEGFYNYDIQDIWDAQDLVNTIMQYDANHPKIIYNKPNKH